MPECVDEIFIGNILIILHNVSLYCQAVIMHACERHSDASTQLFIVMFYAVVIQRRPVHSTKYALTCL